MPRIDHSEWIHTLPRALNRARCQELIAYAESLGFGDAPVTTAHGPVMRKDIRNNDRVMTDDESLAAELWAAISEVAPSYKERQPIKLNERLRFYRYRPGQRFDWHYDGSFRRPGERSFYTLMFYLNEDFEGGETSFKDDATIHPKTGDALMFMHRQLHTGAEVTRGVKYVIRTDIMYQGS